MKPPIYLFAWLIAGGSMVLFGPAAPSCWAEATPPTYFQRTVEVPEISEAELIAIVLDAPFYAKAADAWKQSRIVDDREQVVPYLLRQVTTTKAQTVRKSWVATQPTLRPLPTDGLEILVQLQELDPVPDRLRLITPLDNFEQGVQVESSADGTNWQPLVEDATIFDYARYMDVRNDQIPLPPTPHKYFRIVVDQVTAAQESRLLELTRSLQGDAETARTERLTIDRRPFRISQLEFSAEVAEQRNSGPQIIDYPPQAIAIEQVEKLQETHILISTGFEPLTQLVLLTDDKNFSRRARVEVETQQGDNTTWRDIGQGTVSRIDFKTLQREELTLSFPQTQAAKFRLVIENRDAAPLNITGVTARGHVYELVALAEPGREYRLRYGQASAPAAQLDTTTLETLLGHNFTPKPVQLGPPEQVTGEIAEVPFRWQQWLNDPRIFIPIIVLLVGLLGWGLVRAAKRVDQLP
jgi:hypothetical protein